MTDYYRTRRGEEAPNAALTQSEVEEIRERYRQCGNVSQVAREFGRNKQTVWRAVRHYSYTDDDGS